MSDKLTIVSLVHLQNKNKEEKKMCNKKIIHLTSENGLLYLNMNQEEKDMIEELCLRFLDKGYGDRERIFNFLLVVYLENPEEIKKNFSKPREEWLGLYKIAETKGIKIKAQGG